MVELYKVRNDRKTTLLLASFLHISTLEVKKNSQHFAILAMVKNDGTLKRTDEGKRNSELA